MSFATQFPESLSGLILCDTDAKFNLELIKVSKSPNPIPEETAIRLCKMIRERNKKIKIGFSKMMCWGCSVAAQRNEKNR